MSPLPPDPAAECVRPGIHPLTSGGPRQVVDRTAPSRYRRERFGSRFEVATFASLNVRYLPSYPLPRPNDASNQRIGHMINRTSILRR